MREVLTPTPARWFWLALLALVSCTTNDQNANQSNVGPAVNTGGVSGLGSGGSAASDAGQPEGGGAQIVAVPNDQDEYPVPKSLGLAPTPPMGWSSWNAYSTGINAERIRSVADIMVSSGMKDAGYLYVNIDDGWALTPRATSDSGDAAIEPDPAKFPPDSQGNSGIKVLADYVHAKGLKLGVYSDRGTQTCGKYTASGGYELSDTRAFASWGVDYLKYDNCFVESSPPLRDGYQAMRDALDSATDEFNHDIVFSLCSWQFDEWNAVMGQLWRTTGDIAAVFNDTSLLSNSYSRTLLQVAAGNKAYAAYAGPNHWNDADMLEVGNLGNTAKGDMESQTHFSLWAMMAAPLIAGNTLESMTDTTRAILTNRKVISIDQDYLGIQGVPVKSTDSTMVWAKPLNKAGARAVLLINSGNSTQNVSVSLPEIGLTDGAATSYDLVNGTDNDPGQPITNGISADISSHGSVLLEVVGQEPGLPVGTAYLSDLLWTYAANGSGLARKNKSNSGGVLSINGAKYASGLGVAAGSKLIYRLARRCSNFSAVIGVDDSTQGAGSVQFQVWADGERLYPQGDLVTMKGNDMEQNVSIDLSGKYRLTLLVTSAGDGATNDYADWAEAKLTCAP